MRNPPRISAATSERMILENPGFAQNFLSLAQEQTHLDRLCPGDGEVELRAPMAWRIVRHRLAEDIGEGSARRPEHRLRLDAERKVDERRTRELDHEFAHALGARL